MQHTFIIDGVRTPIGSFGGALAPIRADDLAAHVIRSLMARHPDFDPALIDDVILGCANQAGEDNRNVARMSLLLAGMPVSVPGQTINRLCASGLAAVNQARQAVCAGDGEFFIAGGVENMTRGPYVVSKSAKPFGTDAQMYDSSFGWRFINPAMQAMYGTESMGQTAENLAELYEISREDQDRFALWSQQKAATARQSGRFQIEISPINAQQPKGDPIEIAHDEFIKPGTTLEGLSRLKTAFKKDGGTVTAGNASGLNDGAAALLLSGEKGLWRLEKPPLARIVSAAVTGVAPRIMGIGPVEASKLALKRAGLTLDQMDLIELNEAFAAQVLACTRQLGVEDQDPRLNPNGGAIALGHPLGMSGARIILSAALQLHQTGGRFALCTMCIGVGQGYAVVIEKA